MDLNPVKFCITDGALRAVGKTGDDIADLLFIECPGSAVFSGTIVELKLLPFRFYGEGPAESGR